MKILIDIDDTLYDSVPLMMSCFATVLDIAIEREHRTEWDFFFSLGVSRADFDRLLAECYHTPAQIRANAPYPGAAETLAAWHARGHEIHVVSDRADAAAAPTEVWLREQGLAHSVVTLRHPVDKFAYIGEQGIDLAIDDRPSLLIDLLTKTSVAAATLRQPQTMAVEAAFPRQLITGNSWAELRGALEMRLPALARPVERAA